MDNCNRSRTKRRQSCRHDGSQWPALVSVGQTETATANNAKAQIEEMNKLGMTTKYVEIPEGTHMSMIPPTVPQIFEFFSRYKRR